MRGGVAPTHTISREFLARPEQIPLMYKIDNIYIIIQFFCVARDLV